MKKDVTDVTDVTEGIYNICATPWHIDTILCIQYTNL